MQCTIQAAEGEVCDCVFTNAPVDQNASVPEKQKEIIDQSDFKFIPVDNSYSFLTPSLKSGYNNYHPPLYTFMLIDSVFHPPGLRLS